MLLTLLGEKEMKELTIQNVPVTTLKKEYGTPLFIYDEQKLLSNMAEFKENFKSTKFETEIIYASKAFTCLAMVNLVKENGLSLDVVSGGELYIANKVGMSKDRIYFHGNNKSGEELKMALSLGVTHIVCDNFGEIQELEEIAKELNANVKVLIRMNTGVDAHTHKFIVTSHIDSKFGLIFNSEEYKKAIAFLEKSENLEFVGFHSHIGSQIFEMDGFYASIDKLLDMASTFSRPLILDMGGGFGIRYTSKDMPIPLGKVSKLLIEYMERKSSERNIPVKKFMIEPGRSIVAEAGYTLYTIGNQKVTPNKHYYFVDGGMADNIRPALYQAEYDADVATRMDEPKTENITVAGKYCESGDIIIENIPLQKADKGDLLITYSTGAYGYSMSSNYNKSTRPAIVFVKDGKSRLVVSRESYEDLIKNDIQ